MARYKTQATPYLSTPLGLQHYCSILETDHSKKAAITSHGLRYDIAGVNSRPR